MFRFEPEGRKYAAAAHADGVLLAKPDLFPGAPTRPAKPGDVILLFGTGFGRTEPHVPADEIVATPRPLKNPVTIRIGGVVVEVSFAGLVSPGLYQFNVEVPAVADGDHAVTAEIRGFRSSADVYVTVRRPTP